MTGEPYVPSWRDHANCAGEDPDLFFGKIARGQDVNERVTAARRICAACQVREECLAYAVEACEPVGVWGGKTARERRAIRVHNLSVKDVA